LKKQQGRNGVEHISTALAPIHREATINQIKKRLEDENDINWTLVATSCVEAGMNFSFKTAAREMCSLVSTIQTAGRINRSGERGESVLWNFKIVQSDLLIRHPAFQLSASILEVLFKESMVSPDNCSEAMKREIRRNNYASADDDEIVKTEVLKEFPSVNEMFRVISNASVTAVVNKGLVARLQDANQRKMVKQSELQRYSVNIYPTKIKSYALKPICGFRNELYEWNLDYDDFLGYMAGVLKLTPDPNNFYF
jgi:CRISPR-associated endonuclease/helicase Cas3